MWTISTSIRHNTDRLHCLRWKRQYFGVSAWKITQIIIQTIMEIVAAGGKKHKFC